MGGQERLVLRLAKGLQARGHDTHVVTFVPGGALESEFGSIPVHAIARRSGFDPSLYGKLWQLFGSLRPDVVHTHNAAPLVYAVPAARARRVRCVVHTKHGNFAYPKQTLRLSRIASRLVDHFVAVSTETASAALENERPSKARLAVIENGIPLDAFGPDRSVREAVRDELGIPRDGFVVGSVGRLVRDKDYPLLVRAVAPLLGHTWLVLVGEGTERAEIERTIEASVAADHRNRVILTGARRDVPRLLASFDVFASSSRTEGLPLALAEAMTSNLPIVATAVGGVPGIVPAEAGVLVPHGQESTLRIAIEGFCGDEGRRSRMGAAARSYAMGRFAEERMLAEYLARYAR